MVKNSHQKDLIYIGKDKFVDTVVEHKIKDIVMVSSRHKYGYAVVTRNGDIYTYAKPNRDSNISLFNNGIGIRRCMDIVNYMTTDLNVHSHKKPIMNRYSTKLKIIYSEVCAPNWFINCHGIILLDDKGDIYLYVWERSNNDNNKFFNILKGCAIKKVVSFNYQVIFALNSKEELFCYKLSGTNENCFLNSYTDKFFPSKLIKNVTDIYKIYGHVIVKMAHGYFKQITASGLNTYKNIYSKIDLFRKLYSLNFVSGGIRTNVKKYDEYVSTYLEKTKDIINIYGFDGTVIVIKKDFSIDKISVDENGSTDSEYFKAKYEILKLAYYYGTIPSLLFMARDCIWKYDLYKNIKQVLPTDLK